MVTTLYIIFFIFALRQKKNKIIYKILTLKQKLYKIQKFGLKQKI